MGRGHRRGTFILELVDTACLDAKSYQRFSSLVLDIFLTPIILVVLVGCLRIAQSTDSRPDNESTPEKRFSVIGFGSVRWRARVVDVATHP